MGEYKTPGVYIKEKNAFGNSVVEAETAIPAFIGFTQKAVNGDKSLLNQPWKITSMTEFTTYFGGAPLADFKLEVESNNLTVTEPAVPFTLYYQMVMFFANGGSTCYIVSVGNYKSSTPLSSDQVKTALTALEKEQEVTMIVVPEAVYSPNYANILTDVLQHCGSTMKNRFAIFDVQPKKDENEAMEQQIESFRGAVGSNYMSFGAAYYPWLNTSVLSENDVTPSSVTLWDYTKDAPDLSLFFDAKSEMPGFFKEAFAEIKNAKKKIAVTEADADGNLQINESEVPMTEEELAVCRNNLHNALLQNWPAYKSAIKLIKDKLNLLPPSASMAGIYTAVDNNRGVWKAPANVTVSYVTSPTEVINDYLQENLNVPMNGKAVNAIRSFPGEGIKVWGARTLDGNSQDWRYVNVRRTMLFLEESVKNAARAYVFEPNDANTWINMKCMIENFLRSVWKRGGLAGATPEDAFEVHVGLGDTITGDDILEGILRITVLVAISRPAEFIEITFQQQMQKS